MITKAVKDIYVSSAEYPHIPSEYTLGEAIDVFKKHVIARKQCIKPIVALVFKGNKMVGTLRMRDILKGLEPEFLEQARGVQGFVGDRAELSVIWDTLFYEGSKAIAEKSVTEAMEPIKAVLSPDDSIVKAAYIMINSDLLVVPVMENDKLVGIVRMIEVFDELSGNIVADAKDDTAELTINA